MKILDYLTAQISESDIAEIGMNLPTAPEDAEIVFEWPVELRTAYARLTVMSGAIDEIRSKISEEEDHSIRQNMIIESNTITELHNAMSHAIWHDVRESIIDLSAEAGLSENWKIWQRKPEPQEASSCRCDSCGFRDDCPSGGTLVTVIFP